MHKFTTDELVSMKPSPKTFSNIPRNPVVFILHNIRSLQNIGLFFRLADAFLIEKIYLTGYSGFPRAKDDTREERIIVHAENQIQKTAINLIPFVPWQHISDIDTLLNDLANQGIQTIGVEQTDQSVDYRSTAYNFPLALLFGHERTGVEDSVLEKCNLVIDIPMLGIGNSHNVAVSAGIITSFVINKLSQSA